MGMDYTLVLSSDTSHLRELTCTLCNRLTSLDSWVTVSCSHPFCKKCLETWIAIAPSNAIFSCPNCGVSIASEPGQLDGVVISGTSINVRTLKADQPLLFRLLTKVQVCCPSVKDKMCNWKGDYGQLQIHKNFVHKGVAITSSRFIGVSKSSGRNKLGNDMCGHTKETNANLLSTRNTSRTRTRSMSPSGPTIPNSSSSIRSQSISPTRKSSMKLESGKRFTFERNVPSRPPKQVHFNEVKVNTPRSEAQQTPKEAQVHVYIAQIHFVLCHLKSGLTEIVSWYPTWDTIPPLTTVFLQ
jgi:hypothetical protein